MRSTGPWIAFLTTLFLLVGLCGLFASYAVGIPLERALARGQVLDQVLADPDPAAALRRLEPVLGTLGAPLNGMGALADRVAAARAVVRSEQERESASLTFRVRLMLVVMTLLAAALGGGMMALARRSAAAASERQDPIPGE